nr:S-adenosylmethionine synthetase N-terminal domain-containing protein [Numidum massiliense]
MVDKRGRRLFTSESVTEGHPDKICDQISDAVLDAILKQDPEARVACETAITTGLVLVAGEITTTCYVDIPKIVRKTIADIGYTRAKYGFDASTCAVLTSIDEQSPEIAAGVDVAYEGRGADTAGQTGESPRRAGGQRLMFCFLVYGTEEIVALPNSFCPQFSRPLRVVRCRL